jgi:hypothetical protein
VGKDTDEAYALCEVIVARQYEIESIPPPSAEKAWDKAKPLEVLLRRLFRRIQQDHARPQFYVHSPSSKPFRPPSNSFPGYPVLHHTAHERC